MVERVESVDVLGLHLVPRDDEHVVSQLASVEVFQHGEGVRPDDRQERVSRPVEHLNRRHVRLEVTVIDQFLHRLGVGHERTRYPLIPQAVGMPDAVGTVQRAALNVVQAQAALAVLHDFAGLLGQMVDLIPAQQGNTGGHLANSRIPWGRTRFGIPNGRVGRKDGNE
ncbi:hypothetical protein [Candidatus Protofrankia californiensis]|uniref:hypothetical protein n=1 Tax=Candidatus Protofrankia californiensis TaxID=1839754 RepID=UPI0019CFAE71|nr:hypothetical protein [Candidatus Protofrankia californiensis]